MISASPSLHPLKDQSLRETRLGSARQQLDATTKAVRKRLPKDADKLWGWLTGQDQKALLAVLAVCAGHTVDAVEKKRGGIEAPPSMRHAGELAEALKLDMAGYWQPTAESYFGHVPKALILAAVAEGAGQSAAATIATLKKDTLAAEAQRRLAGKGWLPAILRTV